MDFSYYTDDESHADILQALEWSYTIEDLKTIKRCIKPFFTQLLPTRKCDPRVTQTVQQTYTAHFSATKKRLTELLGLLFCTADNFLIYYNWLQEPYRKIWTDMLVNNGISTREMNLRYNLRIPGLNLPGFEMRNDIFPSLSFFHFELFYNSTLDFAENIGQYHLTLPAPMRTLCIPFFYEREKYEITPVATLPPGKEWLVYENKQEILLNLPIMMGIEQHGYMPLNLKGTVNLNTIQTAKRKMEMSEFFESVIHEVANLRGALLLPVFLRYKFTGSDPEQPEKYLKRVFNNLLPMDFSWLLPVLLHHLKGFRQIERTPTMGCRPFLTILNSLQDLPEGKWLSIDNLLLHFAYTGEDLMPFCESYLDRKSLYFRGEILLIDEYYGRVTVPFIKSVFFLLAAFGLVYVAYAPYSISYDCYYESLQYARLTADDIQNKIDFFHQFVCEAPSEVWQQFFETIACHINPLEEVKGSFRLFRISPENKELVKLIARDPHINKYVLKVEDYHLLIHSKDYSKVVNRLKTYGYLL